MEAKMPARDITTNKIDGVYTIINLVNGKAYVGQNVNWWSGHRASRPVRRPPAVATMNK
jgi:hypothetical protein